MPAARRRRRQAEAGDPASKRLEGQGGSRYDNAATNHTRAGQAFAASFRENSMTIQRFETGARMSQAVVHGDTVYLAGIVANNAGGESVTRQTQDVLATIDSHLKKAGTDKSKLLSATIYLTDMKSYNDMNAVWDAWVSPGNTPARATVEVQLANPKYNVEIMVIAAR
jgi:enamine deaminase RidA (YjgF/YER057c/UK114 family)